MQKTYLVLMFWLMWWSSAVNRYSVISAMLCGAVVFVQHYSSAKQTLKHILAPKTCNKKHNQKMQPFIYIYKGRITHSTEIASI
jgi:hypothetical protein